MAEKVLYSIEYFDAENDLVQIEINGDDVKYAALPRKAVSGRGFIEYPEVEDLSSPIRPASLRLELQADEDEDFLILWTENEREFSVNLQVDGVLLFRGWIKPDGIFQDWSRSEYNLSIDATDGLGFLEDLAYVDANTGLNFTGLKKPIRIISDCLKLTGFQWNIYTLPDIEYVGQTAFTDVLDETYMKVDRYIRGDDETTASAKEVLENILTLMGLCITSKGAGWWIYDPEYIARNNKNVYYRYTEDGNFIELVSQFDRETIGSHIDGYSLFHINENQRLEMRPSFSAVRVLYEYGKDEALIDNYLLEHNGVSYSGWTISDPTRHTFGPNNKGALIGHDESVIVMEADPIPLVSGDLISIRIDVTNPNAPFEPRVLCWRARIGNNNYIRKQGGLGTWQSQSIINESEVQSQYGTVLEFPVEEVPTTGNLIFEIRGFKFETTTQGALSWNEVSISPRDTSGAEATGETHTVTLPGGTLSRDPIEVANGDNPSSVYYGTIFKTDQLTPTTEWTRVGQGETKRILRLRAEKEVRMNQKPTRYFSGSVYGLQEYLNLYTINNIDGKFITLGYSYDTLTRIGSFIVRQIYDAELSGETYEAALDYGNTVKPTIVG